MLSRTANSIFWLARYMERADYLARLLEVGARMSGMGGSGHSEWKSAVNAAGVEESYLARHGTVTPETVIDYLACDPTNPSSILSCFNTARANARSIRTALTSDMWQSINDTWLEARHLTPDAFSRANLNRSLDWVKTRALLFNGAYQNTMLRNDAFYFTCLGTALERADNTARILDVKYHVLLPNYEQVGGVVDFYQWSAILRSVSALRAYHWVYNDRIKPWNVAELLILRPEMPRSLISCFAEISRNLDFLAHAYGGRTGECHRLVGELYARLKYGRIEAVFQGGLHEFLTDYVDKGILVGDEIAKLYLL